MSSDPSSKSAAKNGRRFDLRHMKFSVFNTDWVTNERGSISSRSRDHFKLRTCTKTRSRNVPFWCMNWAKSCTRWGHAHTSYNFPFFFAGFFCFSFFFSCFVFYLRIFCEIFLRFLCLNNPECRGLLPFYYAFNIF